MTPYKLICLRLWGITLGRFDFMARALHRVLLWRLVYRKTSPPFCASSRFFGVRELDDDGEGRQDVDTVV
jgi:hypothetical protein